MLRRRIYIKRIPSLRRFLDRGWTIFDNAKLDDYYVSSLALEAANNGYDVADNEFVANKNGYIGSVKEWQYRNEKFTFKRFSKDHDKLIYYSKKKKRRY